MLEGGRQHAQRQRVEPRLHIVWRPQRQRLAGEMAHRPGLPTLRHGHLQGGLPACRDAHWRTMQGAWPAVAATVARPRQARLAACPGARLALNPKAAVFAAHRTATACRLEAERPSPGEDVAGSRGLSHLCSHRVCRAPRERPDASGAFQQRSTTRLAATPTQEQLCAEELFCL